MDGKLSNFVHSGNVSERFEQFRKDFRPLHSLMQRSLAAMKTIYNTNGYIAEPHGAIGYLGLKRIAKSP
jgi:threonine synthase